MEIIDPDTLKRPPHGDELPRLVNQLKELKAMKRRLLSDEPLFLCVKGGGIFGELLRAEIREPQKRLAGKIEKRIEQVVKEIRLKTEAL